MDVAASKRIGITHRLAVFGLIWFGQMVSIVGSSLTRFALSIWVYQETGSVTQFALISFFGLLPLAVLLPVAGALIDRWDRRAAMIVSDTIAAVSTLVMLLLLSADLLAVWHIYVLVTINAAAGAFQSPAYGAVITVLIPQEHLGRANGMVQLGPAVARIVAPALAGLLIAQIGINGIFFIDLVTFLLALTTLLVVRIPRPPVSDTGVAARGSLLKEALFGWHYIRARPGLSGLLAFSGATNMSLGMVWLLIVPLVFSFTDVTGLGVVLSLAGTGMLLGGLVMSIWGGPCRRVRGMFAFTLVQGVMLLLGGFQPNAVLVVVAAWVFLFSFQIVVGSEQVIWQRKVEPDVQGRVFAVRETVSWAATALAYVLAGPLSDAVFEPLLSAQGALAGSVGQIIGVGPGRGIGLLFIVLGLSTMLITLFAFLHPRIRLVEHELPDVIAVEQDGVTESQVSPSPSGAPSPPPRKQRRRGRRYLVVALILLLIVTTAGGALTYTVRRPWPQTTGTLTLSGLQAPVDVVRDRMGVPQIYAENEHDLLMAQGYVHAQDRLWQMDFNRNLGSGTLASILGASAVESDRFIRTVGLRRNAERTWNDLDDEMRALLEAYCAGVNAYIATNSDRLPLEYTVLRVAAPRPWTPIDIMTWGNFMSLRLGGNYRLELLRAQLYAHIGEQPAEQLLPPTAPNTPIIIPDHVSYDSFRAANFGRLDRIDEWVGDPTMPWGSNNWVIHGSRTKTGAPILANDTHLGLQTPSQWYENGLHGGRFDTVGFSFPGAPFVIMGYNQSIAWGISNLGPDVQDLYMERLDDRATPTAYEFKGEWVPLNIFKETIEVSDGEAETLTIRETRHGPLMNGIIDGEALPNAAQADPMSLAWTVSASRSILPAVMRVNLAGDWPAFRDALREWDTPGQNFVYADQQGNIGYQATGLVPIRVPGHQGLVPVPGWTGTNEWQGFVPFDSLPSTFNPSAGFIATANNKITTNDDPYPLSYDWFPGYRAQRITDILAANDKMTREDVEALQLQTYSIPAESLRPLLAALEPQNDTEAAALDAVRAWDLYLDTETVGGAVYQTWYNFFVQNTIEDDLGEQLGYTFFAGNYHRHGNSSIPMMIALADDPTNPWFDDQDTPESENRDDIARRSLTDATAWLREHYGDNVAGWRWGRMHTVTFYHLPLGASGIPVLSRLVNGSPLEVGGDNSTVNAASFQWNLPFEVIHGTSQRLIVDLHDLDQSVAINPPGQSGHIQHIHYHDMLSMWQQGIFKPLPASRQAVDAQAAATLTLTP